MDLSMVALDVDGTLRSPLIFALVLLYAAVLAGITAALASFWLRGGRSRLVSTVVALSLAPVFFFNTDPVRTLAAAIIAGTSSAGVHVGVGFIGSHPTWLAPVLGLTAGIAISVRHRLRTAAV